MDERGSYEKLSIRDSARSLKKYGSTNRHTVRENYIKHIIRTGDTLQGISLKYGVTMEHLRRANRLYTTDSLFLREYLLIPATESNPEKKTDQNDHVPASPNSIDNSEDACDFLGKIDAAIANTKKEIKRVQVNSKFTGGAYGFSDDDPGSSFRRNTTNGDANGIFTAPKTMVVTHDRKVRTSIKRHEWQQDELFEL